MHIFWREKKANGVDIILYHIEQVSIREHNDDNVLLDYIEVQLL